jgi:hypothetical protein
MEHGFDDRLVGRLPMVVGVEDQWVLSKSPGPTVAKSPEGDSLQRVFVLGEDGEQAGISIRLGL